MLGVRAMKLKRELSCHRSTSSRVRMVPGRRHSSSALRRANSRCSTSSMPMRSHAAFHRSRPTGHCSKQEDSYSHAFGISSRTGVTSCWKPRSAEGPIADSSPMPVLPVTQSNLISCCSRPTNIPCVAWPAASSPADTMSPKLTSAAASWSACGISSRSTAPCSTTGGCTPQAPAVRD